MGVHCNVNSVVRWHAYILFLVVLICFVKGVFFFPFIHFKWSQENLKNDAFEVLSDDDGGVISSSEDVLLIFEKMGEM